MMTTVQLKFLQTKVAELQTALFSNESDAVLKLSTTIVKALTVDDAGQIWFFVTKPSQYLQEFDKEFPSKMKFSRKDKEYFLDVTGKAYIINDPEEIARLVSLSDEIRDEAINNRHILVKMRVQKAEYYEKQPIKAQVGFNGMFTKFFKTIFDFKPGLRPAYYMQDAA